MKTISTVALLIASIGLISCEFGDDMILRECTCVGVMSFNINFTEIHHPFFKEDITSQFAANSTCTKENLHLCKTKCDQVMREMSNDYDLTKVPKNAEIQETLGQYICDTIGKDVNYKNVLAAYKYYCSKDGNTSTGYERTNPPFESICCEKAKFQEKCKYDPNKDEDLQKFLNTTLIV